VAVAGGFGVMSMAVILGIVATQVITFFSIKTGILSTRVFTKSIPALGGTWFGLKEYTPTSNPIGDKVTVLGNRFI
jgi:hypothetical protein